jgi:acyl carrier protein
MRSKTLTKDEITKKLIEVIGYQMGIDPEEIKPESTLREDLAIDSLDMIELVMDIEAEFEITIDDKQAEELRTVGEAVELVAKLVGEKAQCP